MTDVVICVSEPLWSHTIRSLRVSPDRCLLLRNGIDFDEIPLPSTLPIEEDDREAPPCLAVVCRLAPVKNIPLAVRAFAALREKWPRLTMHVVGDGQARPAIEALADQLDLQSCVHFHGASTRPWAKVPEQAIVIQSSNSEGLSLSLIEALAHGHRIVATDVGETRVFCDGVEGVRIVPPADLPALTNAIDDMLKWPPLVVQRTTAANRAHARIHGDLDHLIDQLVNVYDRSRRDR
jgi:glycosyltransferase involved in cell wall biosynthesis